jgi:hypothetical protein
MYTSRGSRGALQKRYQSATQNLHFTGPHITVITMGIPFVVAFEVEAVEPC